MSTYMLTYQVKPLVFKFRKRVLTSWREMKNEDNYSQKEMLDTFTLSDWITSLDIMPSFV